jgi:hypothetical protein
MTALRLLPSSGLAAHTDHCPFYDAVSSQCRAALLAYLPDAKHLYSYCCSDDHDACTLFLGKALRSSASGGLERDLATHGGK